MDINDESSVSESDFVDDDISLSSINEKTDSESISSEESETLKLREELPFTQLQPYKSDILKLIVEKEEPKIQHTETKNHIGKFHRKRYFFKEVHNETIGDIFIEDINLPRKHLKFTKRLPLPIKKYKDEIMKKDMRLIDPTISDLNFATMIGIPITEFVLIFSYLFFGVFLEDPQYEEYIPNVENLGDETLNFIIKYFKYRLKSLKSEYAANDDFVSTAIGNKDADEDLEDQKLLTSKILPLLLILRDKVNRI